MRLLLLASLALSSTAFASNPPVPAAKPDPGAKIRAELPRFVRVPARQLASKKFQTFSSDANRGKAWTSVDLIPAHGPAYEVALQAKTTYPGRTFVVRNLGNGTEWLKSPATK